MIEIRAMSAEDWEAVRAIFLAGIATGNATFETAAPGWERWDREHVPEPRLVACERGMVVGWAALSPVSARPVYAGVAEASVYVAEQSRNRRVGRALMEMLVHASETAGIWTLQAGVFPENRASLALLRACGFREVGRRRRLGKLGGAWRDVVLLERRSDRAGTE
jgi:phosphinothricin acetyltransferase